MIATTIKRMDAVERNLSPKEFAIILADTMRKFPSNEDFVAAELQSPSADNTTLIRPYNLLAEQVERRYGGRVPADRRRSADKEIRALQLEYHTLKHLIYFVNTVMTSKAQTAGLEAALRAQYLQAVIMQDSFSRTARKAVLWIEEYRTADREEESNRQQMIAELSAYFFDAEVGTSSVDLGSVRIDLPSQLQLWVDEIKSLVFDLYKHRDAVTIIEAKFYDGHRILAKNVEDNLQRIIRVVEGIIESHNEYLKSREDFFRAEWDEDEAEGLTGGLAGERQGRLRIDLQKLKSTKAAAKRQADEWLQTARMEAKAAWSNEASELWQEFHQPRKKK